MEFELSHGMLKAGPFFRHKGHKFQAKLLCTTPADDRFLNLERRFFIRGLNPDFQRGSRPDFDGAVHSTTTEGQIDDIPIASDDVQ